MSTIPARRSPLERVYSWLAAMQFRLFQRHRHERVTLEEVEGVPLIVLPGVLNPVLFRTGEYLVQRLNATLVPPGSTVLDMGSGTGVGAIFAARWAKRVVAVDVNPTAVRCSRLNVLLHALEATVSVREGDLFAPVAGERFDVILFNPPYFSGEPGSSFERAFYANDVAQRFAEGVPHHLSPGGSVLLLLSSAGESEAFLEALRAQGLTPTLLHEQSLKYETLWLYRVTLTSDH